MLGLQGGALNHGDYKALEERWIDRHTANNSLLRRVDSFTGAEIVGRNGSGRHEGIAIPYVWPGLDRVREYRLRRDHPEIENGKPKNRYISPRGRGNMLYFPIGCDPQLLTDPTMPIVVTEGEFKTIALARASSHALSDASERPRFLPIGLPGVWNWRGTIGKTVDSTGTRVDEKGPIADLSRVSWEGRTVTIIFDADLETKEEVRVARTQLTRELQGRGAHVRHFKWPRGVPVQVKGIDDLLAAIGPDEVLKLIEQSNVPNQPGKRNPDSDAIIKRLADEITSSWHFAKDVGGKLYAYNNGVYLPDGEKLIKGSVKTLLVQWGFASKWRSIVAKETAEFIGVDAPELQTRPSSTILNLQNGLLDLRTGELLPHHPDFRSSLQFPVLFDPKAACPETKKFLSEVIPKDSQALYFELIAWLVTINQDIQKAVLLIGEGCNGKSTLLNAMTAFLGRHNVSAIPLHRLESDRFSPARLVGKVANICADLPSAHLVGTSAFKALTGGDEVLGERKFINSFEFHPFARLVFRKSAATQSGCESRFFPAMASGAL